MNESKQNIENKGETEGQNGAPLNSIQGGGVVAQKVTESHENDKKEQERTKISKVLFLENFIAGKGVIEQICLKIGIDKKTYYRWVEKDPEFVANIKKLQARYNDDAEDVLRSLVFIKRDPGSVKFYLRSKHPDYKLRIVNEITPVGSKSAKELLDEMDQEFDKQENGNNQSTKESGSEKSETPSAVPDQKQTGTVSPIQAESGTGVLLEKKDEEKPNSQSETKGNLQSNRRRPAPRLHSERHL